MFGESALCGVVRLSASTTVSAVPLPAWLRRAGEASLAKDERRGRVDLIPLAPPQPRRPPGRCRHEQQPHPHEPATGHVVVFGEPLPRQAEDESPQPDLEQDRQHNPYRWVAVAQVPYFV